MYRYTLILIALVWITACVQIGGVYQPHSREFEGEAPLCCDFMDAGEAGQGTDGP